MKNAKQLWAEIPVNHDAMKRRGEEMAELLGRDLGPKAAKKIDRKEFDNEPDAREFARDALRAGYLISSEQFGATTIIKVFQLVEL